MNCQTPSHLSSKALPWLLVLAGLCATLLASTGTKSAGSAKPVTGLDWQMDPTNRYTANQEQVEIARALTTSRDMPISYVRTTYQIGRYSHGPGDAGLALENTRLTAMEAARLNLSLILVLDCNPPSVNENWQAGRNWKQLGGSTTEWARFDAQKTDFYRVAPKAVWPKILELQKTAINTARAEYTKAHLDPDRVVLVVGNEMNGNMPLQGIHHQLLDYFVGALRDAFPTAQIAPAGLNGSFDWSHESDSSGMRALVESMFGLRHPWQKQVNLIFFHRYYPVRGQFRTPEQYGAEYASRVSEYLKEIKKYTSLPVWLGEYGVGPSDLRFAVTMRSDELARYRVAVVKAVSQVPNLSGAIYYTASAMGYGLRHPEKSKPWYTGTFEFLKALGVPDSRMPTATADRKVNESFRVPG